MKVSKEKTAENRELILDAAAGLFRERGLAEVGVDALGAAAGLSHGSVYSQFGSKENLIAEAMKHGFAKNGARAAAHNSLEEVLAHYLSAKHRDRRSQGCVIAALGCEMSRQSRTLRQIFAEGVRRKVQQIAALLGGSHEHEDDALVLFASMVGAVILARAVNDPQLSDRILSASRKHLLEEYQEQAA